MWEYCGNGDEIITMWPVFQLVIVWHIFLIIITIIIIIIIIVLTSNVTTITEVGSASFTLALHVQHIFAKTQFSRHLRVSGYNFPFHVHILCISYGTVLANTAVLCMCVCIGCMLAGTSVTFRFQCAVYKSIYLLTYLRGTPWWVLLQYCNIQCCVCACCFTELRKEYLTK